MKKTHPTAQHCLTDAPGEQARVALFCAAEHGHGGGGGKHSGFLNREQVGRIWDSAHATDLDKTVSNLEGWVFTPSSDEVGDGWLRASNKFCNACLCVASTLNQNQISSPSSRRISRLVCVSAADSFVDNICVIEPGEPFVHESFFRVLHTPINECCFCVLHINRTSNDFVAYKAHSQASNTIFVCGNTGCGVDSSADLDMAVAEQADVNGFHLSLFQVRPVLGKVFWPKLFACDRAIRGFLDQCAVIGREWDFSLDPLRDVAPVLVSKGSSYCCGTSKVVNDTFMGWFFRCFGFSHGHKSNKVRPAGQILFDRVV